MQDPLAQAARMIVKEGLRLALLDEAERALALGLVAAALPEPGLWTEPAFNAVLKALLAEPMACLDTDHVELRRWLVDTGWLVRDGFGREYRRVPLPALPPAHARIARALAAVPLPAWATAQRQAHRALREARRVAWQTSQPKAA